MGRENRSCTILVVDDDSGLSTLIQRRLQRDGFQTAAVGRGAEAINWLRANEADLMLLDFKLPDMTGMQVMENLGDLQSSVPFVLITGQGDEKLAVDIMKGGARDYIIKDGAFLDLLPAVVNRVLDQVWQEKQLTAAENALKESEAQYRGIFNSSQDGIFVVDFNGKIVDANPQAGKIYDYSLEDLVNQPLKSLIHPDYLHQYDQFTIDLRSKGEFQAESLAVQKDGTTIDVEMRSTVFTFKGENHILVVVRDISERKWKEEELRLTNQQLRVSEQALREREARLRAIFQGAAIGVALIDLGGRALESNQTLQKMLGYSRSELRQKVFTEFTHEEDLPASVQIFDDLAQGKCDYYQIETRYLHKDKEVVWVRLTASLVRSDAGKPNYVINMMEDVSERKWAEHKLFLNQERFQLLSEAAFEGILIHEDGIIIDGNQALGRMLGYDIPEIIGKDCREFIPEEYRDLVTESIRQDSTTPYEVKGLKKDGSIFAIQVWGHSIEYQDRKVRITTIRDITEQKKAQKELENSEARYRGLFENMQSGFAYHQVIFDQENRPIDYKFLEVNEAFEIMTGFKRAEVIGKMVSKAIPSIKSSGFDWIETYGKVALTGQPVHFEQYSEQLGRWYSISAYSLLTGYFAVIFDDVTERRMIEEEMRIFASDLERSNRELEQYARVVSQHLQAPLEAIINQCLIYKESPPSLSEDVAGKLVTHTYDQAHSMHLKIDALLDYSRIRGPGRPYRAVDLNETLSSSCQQIQSKINRSKAVVEAANLPTVPGDFDLLQRVFINLIDNALKFSGESTPHLDIQCVSTDQSHEITISDNGIGIEPSERERIFDIFHQLGESCPYSGCGIGLSVVRKIVDFHGGRIWVDAPSGDGSTFHISLPIKKNTPKTTAD
ncbi:MAG: PAS domain S-box protein [Planctomycetes bacterium]|nr:PAS domain S-box protein [Planctomycetota bacterium]